MKDNNFGDSDKVYYASLFPENGAEICKVEACTRRQIKNSAMCAKHHFELFRHKPCPWDAYPELSDAERCALEIGRVVESKHTPVRINKYPRRSISSVACMGIVVGALFLWRNKDKLPGDYMILYIIGAVVILALVPRLLAK